MIDTGTLPTLEAERVRLRWLTENDIGAIYEIFRHPEVSRYATFPAFKDEGGAREYIESIQTHYAAKDLFQWGVARRSDDLVIGTCTLAGLSVPHRRAELGYALGPEHQRQGYMSEAVPRLLDFAFEELDLHRIETDIDPRNAPSIRLVERLGFTREGHLRERWFVEDEIQDALFFGLLKREWRQ